MRKNLTLAQIAGMEKDFLTPDEAACIIGCDPHRIRVQAATEAGRSALGFPVVRLGQVTKIPRIPFLRFMGCDDKRGATA